MIERNYKIDIIKGIGIILMVFYHASTPGESFAYLFHMALFFICSGFCFNSKNIKQPIQYIKKKIKSLYLPFLISSIIVLLLHNTLLDLHIYSYKRYDRLTAETFLKELARSFLFLEHHQMISANWFFRTLCMSSIAYMLIQLLLSKLHLKAKNRMIVRAAICVLCTSAGCYLGYISNHGKLFNFLTVMLLIDFGYNLRKLELMKVLNSIPRYISAGILSFLMLCFLHRFGNISINQNKVVNPVFFFCCSISGFVMIYAAACILEKVNKAVSVLCFLGKNSMVVVFCQYIGFKIVTFLEIIVRGDPINKLSSYPTYITDHGLWIVYGIFGIGVSILFVLIIKYLKHRFSFFILKHASRGGIIIKYINNN